MLRLFNNIKFLFYRLFKKPLKVDSKELLEAYSQLSKSQLVNEINFDMNRLCGVNGGGFSRKALRKLSNKKLIKLSLFLKTKTVEDFQNGLPNQIKNLEDKNANTKSKRKRIKK